MNTNIIGIGATFMSADSGIVYTIVDFMVNVIELSSVDENNKTETVLKSKEEIEDHVKSGEWLFV